LFVCFQVGFSKAEATLVVAAMCAVVSVTAYPLGRAVDRHGHRLTLAAGLASLAAGDVVMLASGVWPPAVFIACLFWGVHWAVVQGPLLAAVVEHAPPAMRGTAFGVFYTIMVRCALHGAYYKAGKVSVQSCEPAVDVHVITQRFSPDRPALLEEVCCSQHATCLFALCRR
jgi:MFS family permease